MRTFWDLVIKSHFEFGITVCSPTKHPHLLHHTDFFTFYKCIFIFLVDRLVLYLKTNLSALFIRKIQ